MFVSFRKCSRPQKPDPISDHNCQNLYPFSDQNVSKTIPFAAAHTYIHYIGEYPPPGNIDLSQKCVLIRLERNWYQRFGNNKKKRQQLCRFVTSAMQFQNRSFQIVDWKKTVAKKVHVQRVQNCLFSS